MQYRAPVAALVAFYSIDTGEDTAQTCNGHHLVKSTQRYSTARVRCERLQHYAESLVRDELRAGGVPRTGTASNRLCPLGSNAINCFVRIHL